ncbi:MAG: SDR family oxidoreductase [Nitrososphaeria archaeon]|nr:SDR family oxidoreductase [Nitrososphaeria archaeon]MDW8021650.1 SDR family oxidoreductase [Nitrososphaerota archaeon]
MDLGLLGKAAIVTGSSRGIGKAIALVLAREGAKLVICSRKRDEILKAAEEIRSETGSEVLPLEVDLRIREQVDHMVEATLRKFGRIDILVNNTGGPPSALFEETSDEMWIEAVNQLLMSVIYCCRSVIPHMKKRGWGRIINIASFVAKQPMRKMALSNVLRSGILGLTKTLADELAEYGILVNAVCPGWTLTKRVEDLAKAESERSGKPVENILEEWAAEIPLKRFAKPEEIAYVVAFLASERANYITGTVIQVDGGLIKSIT